MKYLKTYEEKNLKYKEGDMIIINVPELMREYEGSNGQIMDFLKKLENDYIKYVNITKDYDQNTYPYKICDPNWHSLSNYFYLEEKDIYGLATPENIEKYEMEKSMTKFNI